MTRGEGGRLLLPSAGLPPAVLRQLAWRTPAWSLNRPGRPFVVGVLRARRGPVPSARALAAATLLALASAVVLPATAEAQTATTLVSNIDQGSTSSATRSARVAQGFTTGSNPAEYVLSIVDVVSATATGFEVGVCPADPNTGSPPSVCRTTIFQAIHTNVGTRSFTDYAAINTSRIPITLQPDKTYFVVMDPSGDSQGYGVTTEDAEDAAKADQWSIADGSFFENSDGNWESSDDALRIAIKGRVLPTPVATVEAAEAAEGERVEFTVTMTERFIRAYPALFWAASIQSDDTATGADLGPRSQLNGRVSFSQGAMTGTFWVPTTQDAVFEDDETFTVTLETVEGMELEELEEDSGTNYMPVELGESFTAKGTILKDDDVADTTAPSLTEVITFADGRTIALVYDAPYDDPVVIGPVGQTPVQPADPVPEAYADAFSLSIDGVAVNTEPPYVDRTRDRPTEVRLRLAGRKDWTPDQGLVRYLPGQTLMLRYDASKASIGDRSGNQVASFTTGSGGVPAIVNNSTVIPGTSARLKALRVGPYTDPIATLTPPFAPDTTSYAATVGYDTTNVGIAAGRDGWSRLEFLDADDNPIEYANATWYGTAGFMDLAVGENVIKVRVTAEDGVATRTYTLTVTREALVTARAPARTAGLLEVNWTEPTGSAYEVRYWPANEDGSTRRIRSTTDQSILIWPLAANTEYSVRVRARNAEGWSGWSEATTARTGAAQSGRPMLGLHLLDGSGNEITEGAITEGGSIRYRITATNIRNYHDWGDPAMLGRFWLNADVERDRHYPSPWLQSSLDGDPSTSHISCGDVPLLREGLSDTQPDFNQTSATTGCWDFETESFPVGYAEHGPVTLSIQRGDCGGDATVSGTVHTPPPRDPDIGNPSSACATIADDGAGDAYDYLPSNTLQEEFDDKPTYSCSEAGSTGALRGRFVEPPERHDGQKAVDVQVAFTRSVYESEEKVGEHGVRVEGGRVISSTRVGRQPAGSAQAGSAQAGWSAAYAARTAGGAGGYEYVWEFGVEPESDENMTVALDAGRSCDAPGAICTSDGRSLSEGISTTVRGPGDGPAPNTPAAGSPTIGGTPQVGEELTASTSEVSDADGLEDASFAYQWIRTDSDIEEATGSTYTVVDADEGKTLKVRVGFTDDAGNEESLTSAATDVVAAAPELLTATFENVPSEHDGETAFRFRVAFSEPIVISFRALREDAFTVTGGRVTGVGRVDGRKDLFGITVEPDSDAEMTITLPAGRDCAVSGAICGRGENPRRLSNAPTATVAGPADEGPEPNAPATGAPTIGGTPRVGDELTASTSDISDADGLDDASFAYQWIRTDTDITGANGSTYTAVEADEGERLKVRVSFTDDAGNSESLTSAATDAVAARPEPLTASFENMPSEHDGESAFTFRIASSDRLSMMNGRRLREDVVAVTGGRATSAGRVNRRRDLWELTVEPDSAADVTVTVAAGAACGTPAAVCTSDGRALSNTISATVRGPVGIAVADAHVEEDDGAVLAFAVTLSRAASRALTVDYATSDGSAQAGVDYTAASGTLTFQAGESSKTIEVGVLDDAHDEGEETLTLTLSSASGGLLTDGEATGTIENRDPLPRALLARFGRTAAVHVVEHVEERLQAPREPGFRGRFAGRELRRGMERDMALNFLRQLGGSAGVHPAAMGSHTAMAGSPAVGAPPLGTPGRGGGGALMMGGGGPMSGAAGMAGGAASLRTPGLGATGHGGAAPLGAGPHGGLNGGGFLQMGLGGGDLLTGSDFAMNRESRGGILSFWSRGAQSRFSGREGALSLGGDVRTTMFGADYAKGPVVAGLSLSNSRGLGEYAGAAGGQVASSVTGLYPWLGYKMTERVTVWGVAGYGTGGLLLTPDGGQALESGLSMAMAAAGTRGELLAGGASGFELAFKADALWVGTAIDGVDGPAGRLKATDAAVTRFRTGLEGSRAYTLAGRLSLTPSVEVGLRHDGGDAETGAGMDVGAGMVVSDAGTGLAVDVRVRTLLVHQDEDFSERGVSLSLSYNPTPSTPLGFTARVAPSWGGQAMSGAEALWGRETMAGMAHGGVAQGNRLDGEVGYGLPVGSRFVGTPRIGFSASEYGQDYRVGYGLGVLDRESMNFELGVEAQRRNSSMLGGTSNGMLGRATLGW